jgi:parallel beta-helix repeat protein
VAPTCPPLAVQGFTLRGLTVEHASFSGVFLIGVDGYHLTGTSYLDNRTYGPFPVCSHDGLIDFNQVVGGGSAAGPSTDTGIYVGDDDQVSVGDNSVTNYVIGVVVENSMNAIVGDNLLQGNTAGVYVVVFPNHPRPFTDNVLIEQNQVLKNNLPNPVPPGSGDEIGGVPTGIGIVNFGADHVVIGDNRVLGNDSLGLIVLQNFLASADPRIEPNPDFAQVRGNVVLQNGRHPDPARAITPGVDIAYDGTAPGTALPTTSSPPSSRPPSPSSSPAMVSGSLLIRVEGRGGAAGRRQRRQAAVAAAGAAVPATMTASSVAACSMGSARPAPGAAPRATTAARPVPPG